MSESFGEMLKQKLIESNMLSPERFKGCSQEEIQAVMEAQKVEHLPRIFREYLETMGKAGLGNITFIGSLWIHAELFHLKDALISEIEDFEYDFTLPSDAFVFFDHGSVEWHYFLTDNKDDDPPVFMYISEDSQAKQIDASLSEYYMRKFNAYKKHYE